MKKNTKKKVFTLMLVIMLLSIAIVGGSLAWFTAEDSATNTFTIGSIKIKQNEIFDHINKPQLLPVVRDNPEDSNDNYIQKTVTVKNIGTNSAYLQTLVAVPAPLDDAGILKLWDKNHEQNGWKKLDSDINAAGDQPSFAGITINGESHSYNVYIYRYQSALAKEIETQPCLEYVYIDSQTDMNSDGHLTMGDTVVENFNTSSDLNIYVLTQAVQADGFNSVDEALTAAFKNECPTFVP